MMEKMTKESGPAGAAVAYLTTGARLQATSTCGTEHVQGTVVIPCFHTVGFPYTDSVSIDEVS